MISYIPAFKNITSKYIKESFHIKQNKKQFKVGHKTNLNQYHLFITGKMSFFNYNSIKLEKKEKKTTR